MSIKHGAGIVTDGLNFAFDAYAYSGDARFRKSWKGQPTVNEFGGATDFGQWTRESASVDVIDSGTYFQGEKVYKCKTQDGSLWISFNYIATGFRTNVGTTNAVMSAWVKNPNDSSIALSAYIGHDFSGTKTIAANSDWQQIYWSVPVANMANDYCEFRPYGNTPRKWLWMTMPQLEGSNSNYATPFTRTQRTTQTALIDWAGGNTITLNGMQYNTDGTFQLTGATSDYISIANSALSTQASSGIWTIDIWMKRTAAQATIDTFLSCGSGNNFLWYFRNNGTNLQFENTAATSLSAFTVTNNEWFNFTATGSGGSISVYKNGSYVGAMTNATTFTITSTIGIVMGQEFDSTGGSFDAAQSWKGFYGETKFYTRALSATEVSQNFNATRTRYGV